MYNIEYEKNIKEWKEKADAKAKRNLQMEKQISEMQMKINLEHQEEMVKEMTDFKATTLNKAEIEMLVDMTEVNTYRRLEEEKPVKTTQNLKKTRHML